MKYKVIAFCFLFLSLAASAQEIKWWNPQSSAINPIEGQGWQGEYESFYDRLPLRAKSVVRPEVWARSKFSSGLTRCGIRWRAVSHCPRCRLLRQAVSTCMP